MLPGHGRYLLQQPDRLLVVGGFVPLQQGREQDAIVGDDDVGDQPAALVEDRDVKVGGADQLLLAADLGDGKKQLVVGFDTILGPMDVALQLRIPDVVERVDAADQLIEFEDGVVQSQVTREGRVDAVWTDDGTLIFSGVGGAWTDATSRHLFDGPALSAAPFVPQPRSDGWCKVGPNVQ